MHKIKLFFRRVLRLQNKDKSESHHINDREIMAALTESNKEAIYKFEAEEARIKAIADEKRRVREEEVAESAKKAQVLEEEKERLEKINEKRVSATQKFEVKRVKQLRKAQIERLKRNSKR